MNSSTNAKGYSLFAGDTFSPSGLIWDNVLKYNKYFIEITCNKNCQITINQSNDYQYFPPNTYNVKNRTYIGNNTTIYLTGTIIGAYISFRIKNTSAEPAILYFSAVYK
jgi:hypothetical protein